MCSIFGKCQRLFLTVGVLFTFETFAVTGVKNLDYDQYIGTWYEIARFPNKHENGMVEVTSTFKRGKNGKYELVNEGYKGSHNGKKTTVRGIVHIPDPNIDGDMKVRIWFFTIDYKVIDVDSVNYEYALVSSESDKYLWVFSKSPSMDEIVYEKLVESAREKGFDTDKLEMVPQSGGENA